MLGDVFILVDNFPGHEPDRFLEKIDEFPRNHLPAGKRKKSCLDFLGFADKG